MQQVYDMTYRKEILGEQVPNDGKIFSIYELHTDIIVKGSREILFGHKVNIATGKSNLILDCDILKGNPSDSTLYQGTMNRVIENYEKIPRDSATDGGYASLSNLEYAHNKGIVNIPGSVDVLQEQGYQDLFAVEIDYLHPEFGDDTDKAVSDGIDYLNTLKK